MKENVDIHADDFGYSVNTSKDIIDCINNKGLSSISLMVNMPDYDDCLDLLFKNIDSLDYLPNISLHLNLVEGNFEDDYFPKTWGEIFLSTFSIKKKKTKNHYKKEIKNQIEKYIEVINRLENLAKKNNISFIQESIRIDSHVHTHAIPIVWQSLMEVIDERNYKVEYIRNPKEPIFPFLKHTELFQSYNLTNFIKNIVLNIFSIKIDKYCVTNNINTMYMWGLVMSGNMDKKRVNILYEDMLKVSNKKHRKLEILFHPGYSLENEYKPVMNKNNFINFNNSLNRKTEKEAVMNIAKQEH